MRGGLSEEIMEEAPLRSSTQCKARTLISRGAPCIPSGAVCPGQGVVPVRSHALLGSRQRQSRDGP